MKSTHTIASGLRADLEKPVQIPRPVSFLGWTATGNGIFEDDNGRFVCPVTNEFVFPTDQGEPEYFHCYAESKHSIKAFKRFRDAFAAVWNFDMERLNFRPLN